MAGLSYALGDQIAVYVNSSFASAAVVLAKLIVLGCAWLASYRADHWQLVVHRIMLYTIVAVRRFWRRRVAVVQNAKNSRLTIGDVAAATHRLTVA